MSKNISKPFNISLSLINTDSMISKYKCFYGEDIQLLLKVVDEFNIPVNLLDMNARVYYVNNGASIRQDDNITITDAMQGRLKILVKRNYMRLGSNTIRVVLYDEDEETMLQPFTIECVDTDIMEEVPPEDPEYDYKSEIYKAQNIANTNQTNIGDINTLKTTVKSDLVSGINEIVDITSSNKSELLTKIETNTSQLEQIENSKIEINTNNVPNGCPKFKANDINFDNSQALMWLYNNINKQIKLQFNEGIYTFKTPITLNNRKQIEISGVQAIHSDTKGTVFSVDMDGVFIKSGTENEGNVYDWASCNNDGGYYSIKDVYVVQKLADTSLESEPKAKYRIGTKFIENWSGWVKLNNVAYNGFDYGVYTVQSDFSHFVDVKPTYNKTAFYLGGLSDQNIIDNLYGFSNDTIIETDGCSGLIINSPKLVINGSINNAPIKIKSGNRGGSITVNYPWLENFNYNCGTFFEVSGLRRCDLIITDIVMLGTANKTDSLVKILNGGHNVYISSKIPLSGDSVKKILNYKSNDENYSYAYFNLPFYTDNIQLIDKLDSNNRLRHSLFYSPYSVPTIQTSMDRIGFRGSNENKYIEIAMNNTSSLQIDLPKKEFNKTMLKLDRPILSSSSTLNIPDDFYNRGTIIFNTETTIGGYVGWTNINSGGSAKNSFVGGKTYELNEWCYSSNGQTYVCTKKGVSSNTEPSHTVGTQTNGTCEFLCKGGRITWKGFGLIEG